MERRCHCHERGIERMKVEQAELNIFRSLSNSYDRSVSRYNLLIRVANERTIGERNWVPHEKLQWDIVALASEVLNERGKIN